jgi:hypothetical protein
LLPTKNIRSGTIVAIVFCYFSDGLWLVQNPEQVEVEYAVVLDCKNDERVCFQQACSCLRTDAKQQAADFSEALIRSAATPLTKSTLARPAVDVENAGGR